jgi:hypothetical protein
MYGAVGFDRTISIKNIPPFTWIASNQAWINFTVDHQIGALGAHYD